ncbi:MULTISPECIES: IS256 family transposase [Aliivibrio]|jgi:transposase-like protein|uniref:Mutator family transposase n=1 Tax=Aliivibrio finisterrensis TaxID=511998 RepID=A0A4Q5KIP5_9GAMM|nr:MULTISPECIES: IS256 family transposase [Aliivibrio]MDD9180751.1 IS256 family transposase [Aliivibrio sp. A6]MDD9199161.1 IS256 family transposase [Aliivibrio sp. S2MY1]RYU46054.1 IS256 family transposase [Aliivibrio finisterrensis]RYU46526.1 IS256 family transposase [Aliivibrio finisterrensis]RYU50999.1 IS256 family transposase [Aliivibrio finisterrensis]
MNENNNIISMDTPENPLQELLKKGAQQLLAQAIEAELAILLGKYENETINGLKRVVRNGYQPERNIQTGLGDIEVKVPKVRDRKNEGIKFNSSLVPPYLKRTKNIEELIPWLYLRGISTGDMQPALVSLLGDDAKGLSANTVSRLKSSWEEEYKQWSTRSLDKRRYVYIWADGIYSKVRMDDKLCLLVIMGVDDTGRKELLAVVDGVRESEMSWTEVLNQLQSQGLTLPPKLAIGDGALGFWNAITKVWPTTQHQRCWVHKTANILNKVPKSLQPKIKSRLQDIWMAEDRKSAYKAYDLFVKDYSAKYKKATECLIKDKEEMLAFYDFPAEHWVHIRTSNPIESTFATVRLRTHKVKSCGSRTTTLMMVFKLAQSAEKSWYRLKGFKLLADVITGVKFKDGIRVTQDQTEEAKKLIHQI